MSLIPPLSALRAFAAVASHGSFTRAAETLNVSKSAVSHRVSTLESRLGVPLLERGQAGAPSVPTAAGRILLAAVETALAGIGEACEQIARRPPAAAGKRLTVSANAPFCALWLAPRIARFAAAHPGVEVSLSVRDDEPDWQRDGIDLAILRIKGAPGAGQPLLTEVVFPVCSPALLRDGALSKPTDLAEHRLLQEEHDNSPELDWSTWFALLGAGPVPAANLVRFSGFSLAIGAATSGAGVALGRLPLLDFELASGRLVRLFPEYQLAGSWHFVLRPAPHRPPTSEMTRLCAFLRQEAGSA